MSRRWERQVERNAKKVNAQRKRFGKSLISESSARDERHTGRSWILPVFLICVGLFYMISFWNINRDGLYWITVCCYMLLALIVYWLRRPFLTIGKTSLTTRKFAGFRTVDADEIETIEIQSGIVVIAFKNKKSRWVFSRVMNRFDTVRMAERLQDFASRNKVNYVKVNP